MCVLALMGRGSNGDATKCDVDVDVISTGILLLSLLVSLCVLALVDSSSLLCYA